MNYKGKPTMTNTLPMIRTNSDGTPWSVVRTVNGKRTLIAAIQNGNGWTEVPATEVIAMTNKSSYKTAPQGSDRMKETSKQLRELQMKYAAGGVR
jgi:hypothetical protein